MAKRKSQTISKLKLSLHNSKLKLKQAYELSHEKLFTDLRNKLDPAGLAFFNSTFRNAKCKKRSVRDKVFALALYRRGPKLYNCLKQCIPLSSRTTLQTLLKKVPFQPGINNHCLKSLNTEYLK